MYKVPAIGYNGDTYTTESDMRPLSPETAKLLEPINLSPRDRLHLALDGDGKHFVARMSAASYSGLKQAASKAACTDFVQRIPERKELDGLGEWRFGATDFTTTVIAALWPMDQVTMDDDARTVFNYLQLSAERADQVAHLQAQFKIDGVVPAHDLEMSPELPLAPYQQCAAKCSLDAEGYGAFMEQGTGKTSVVISRMCTEARDLGKRKAEEAHRKTIAQLTVECNQRIEEDAANTLKHLELKLSRKRDTLERAAKNAAAKRQCSMNYVGTADMLLAKAKEAVREAELWLGARMSEIAREMVALRDAYATVLAEAHEAFAAGLRADLKRAVGRLTADAPTTDRMYMKLVVCPKNVRMNWQSEVERFATVKHKVTVLRGGKMERLRLFIDAFAREDDELLSIVVCSYDHMVRDIDMLCSVQWDLATLDESHYIKWPDTDRAKIALTRLRDSARQRMVLTGTPVCNSPLDLWSQLEFMREGASGFISWRAFRSFYGVFEQTAGGYERLLSVQNMAFLKERLARYSYQISLREALPDLPEKTYDVIEVEMTKEQQSVYDALCVQLAYEIERDMRDKTITVTNVLTKLLRLTQITSGFVKWDASLESGAVIPGSVEYFDPNPKLEELIASLKERGPLEKSQVWCTFVTDIRHISARLTAEGIDHVTFYGATSDDDRVEAERRFNEDPNCRVFLANPSAGGTGLNLLGYPIGRPELSDTNCTDEYYYSTNWSSVQRSQSEARGHRRGTRVPVRIHDVCVANTIDEEIRKRVFLKRCTAMELADVQDILQAVLGLRL
jgi:hypothetical protein